MRLWTFQHKDVVPLIEAADRYFPSWERTPAGPAGWRLAFQWMTARMYAAVGFETGAPPVWCWHSCGKPGCEPTVGTAIALLGEYDIEQGMVTVELNVPQELALLSSYSEWNQFLDFVIDHKILPSDDSEWLEMFNAPLLKHEFNSIQAVVPYIERKWIVSVSELSIKDRDWSEAI